MITLFRTSQANSWPLHRDNRQAPRFFIRPVVMLELDNGAMARGRLVDMSVNGAFLETMDRPFGLEPGEAGTLGLLVPPESPDSDHRFGCEVIRVTRKGVALRFLSQQELEELGTGVAHRQLMPDDFMD